MIVTQTRQNMLKVGNKQYSLTPTFSRYPTPDPVLSQSTLTSWRLMHCRFLAPASIDRDSHKALKDVCW